MKSRWIAAFLAVALSSQAEAGDLTEQRLQELNDVLELSLQCDVASGLLKDTLAKERESLRQIIASTGSELGTAMLAGQVADPDPGYGMRCLVNFNLPPRQDLDSAEAQFLIGFEIGKVRACMNDLFYRELLGAISVKSVGGVNPEQEQQDRVRAQEFALARFEALGCSKLASSK